MDRLEAMTLLVAAVETGSLSGAGRKLGAPLPTVSRKIAELEARLKTQLLVRSTRRLALTDAGAAYVAACRRILEAVDDAERAAAGEYTVPRGDLVVTAPFVFGRMHVVPMVVDFLARYPEIDVRLILTDRNVDLIDDRVDAALRVGPLADSAMIATRIGEVRRVVCGSPGYFAGHGVPREPDELTALCTVPFDALTEGAHWTFFDRRKKREFRVPIHPRLSVNGAEAAIDAVKGGLGVTQVFCYQVEQAVQAGTLTVVLKDFECAPMPVQLLHAPQAQMPLKLRAFLDFAAPALKARLV